MSAAAASSASSGTMRAALLASPGGPAALQVGETARPSPSAHQVLIRVRGTAVNRADTLQRQGRYNPPPGASSILGLECCGEIESKGEGCERADLAVGARVMALLAGGGYAEYAAVNEGSVMPIPEGMSFNSAAAIPEVWLTAYLIARMLGGLKKDDLVLIHAGASGVGTALIQLCALFGAHAIVSVSSDKKIEFCTQLGAAHGVNYKAASDQPWNAQVKAFTQTRFGKAGVDLVLDPVGGSHAAANADVLAMDGRWILYGLLGGPVAKDFPLSQILAKRLNIEGSTLRARSESFKAELVAAFTRECLPAFSGPNPTLKAIIEKTFPLEQIAEAHALMETNETIGKITITVGTKQQ